MQGLKADMQMPAMRRVERPAQEADTAVRPTIEDIQGRT